MSECCLFALNRFKSVKKSVSVVSFLCLLNDQNEIRDFKGLCVDKRAALTVGEPLGGAFSQDCGDALKRELVSCGVLKRSAGVFNNALDGFVCVSPACPRFACFMWWRSQPSLQI